MVYFPVIFIIAPILYINEVGTGECLFLVVNNCSSSSKTPIEFISFGMSNHKFEITTPIDPFSKTIGHTLRQRLDMRCPGQRDFWPRMIPLPQVIIDGDDISKAL